VKALDYSGWPAEERFIELDAEIAAEIAVLSPDPADIRHRRKPAETTATKAQVSDEQVHFDV